MTVVVPKAGQYRHLVEMTNKTNSHGVISVAVWVLPQGLEPWTPTLRVSCSTN